MIFCDEIFRFINLEETLYFTALDIDLNSFKKDDIITKETLLEINENNLTNSFSCNLKEVKSESNSISRISDTEISNIIN